MFPRDIINAMTALHGALTGVEVDDALRLPLKKKLSALADLPAHIVTFRGHLARLTTAGQEAPHSSARCVQTVSGISVLFPRVPPLHFIVDGG
jgi:hypothetical protein